VDINELDTVMGSGDMDALEKMLDEIGEIEIDDDLPADHELQTKNTDAETNNEPAGKGEQTAPPAADGDGGEGNPGDDTGKTDDDGKVVLSKDGKHAIPYEVLKQHRDRANALEQENQQLRVIKDERDRLQALLDKHQIDVNAGDLENMSDEALAEIADEFPLVGKGFTKLFSEINQLKQLVKPAQPDSGLSVIRSIFESIPELVDWENNNPDRMDYVKGADKALMDDPLWSQKPVRDRFLEAVRRTNAAFVEVAPVQRQQQEHKQEKPAAKEKDPLPNSPSEIGNGLRETATRGTQEYYANLSPEQLQAEMSKMSQADYDRLLESFDL